MHRRILFSLFVLLLAAVPTPAQDARADDELSFVQQLRARGYADLALDYLEKRLAKNPKYAADLPLEIAQARLDLAGSETDVTKRQTIFAQARAEFEQFIAKNPGHPRLANARLQVAKVAALQGRSQLNHALALPETDDTRKDELTRANQLLETAIQGLEAITDQLNTDEAKNGATFERGQLLVSQGKGLIELSKTLESLKMKGVDEALKKSTEVLKNAIALFDNLSEKLENKDPLRPLALAWGGRAYSLNAQGEKAVPKWREVVALRDPASWRLVVYFQMLELYEKEGAFTDQDRTTLIDTGTEWLRQFLRYSNTPEGYGVRYILARMLFERGGKTPARQKADWDAARNQVRILETTENDYSARAQQLKIEIMSAQGAFTAKVDTLINFEDLYMRALFENQKLNRNDKNEFDTDDKKKKQQELILKLLERAFDKAKSTKPNETDLGNAYYLLTGYYLTVGNYDKAAAVGREFAEKHPKSRHASTCAMFAARALSDRIREKAADDWNEMREERKKLFELGEFMAARWPAEKAGELGRYLIVNHLVKEPLDGANDMEKAAKLKEREARAISLGGDVARFQLATERAKEKKFIECIQLLRDVKPSFSNYPLAQYQLALAALQIEDENAQARKKNPNAMVVKVPGDPREMKDIAAEALERIPDSAGADPETKLYFMRAKVRLGLLHYSARKYDQMNVLAQKLEPMLESLKDEDKKTFQPQVATLRLYAAYGKADDLYRAGKYLDVANALDPLVKDLDSGKYPELKENQALMSSLFGMALRSNYLAERPTQGQAVFTAWNKLEEGRIKFKIEQDRAKLDEGIKTLEKTIADQKTKLQPTPEILRELRELEDLEKKATGGKKLTRAEDDRLKELLAREALVPHIELRNAEALLPQQKKQLETLTRQLEPAGIAEEVDKHRASVLEQTFAVVKKQMDEMKKKKGEKERLDRTQASFAGLLQKVREEQKNATPDFRMLLAQCYLSIGRHGQVAELLKDFPKPADEDMALPPPKPNDDPTSPAVLKYKAASRYRQVMVLRVRSLRIRYKEDKNPKSLEEAQKQLDEIMMPSELDKKKNQPGWGKRDINALKEEIQLLMDRNDAWAAAVNRCNALLNVLGPKLREGGVMRTHYFEVGSYYVHAATMLADSIKGKDEMKHDRYLTSAANFFVKLARNYEDLGGDEIRQHYIDFLESPEGAPAKKKVLELAPELEKIFSKKEK